MVLKNQSKNKIQSARKNFLKISQHQQKLWLQEAGILLGFVHTTGFVLMGPKLGVSLAENFRSWQAKKSALNLKEGYTGEAKGGFKYDAIRNHYLRKGSTELVKEHPNCHNQWKRARQMEESKREETKKSSDQV